MLSVFNYPITFPIITKLASRATNLLSYQIKMLGPTVLSWRRATKSEWLEELSTTTKRITWKPITMITDPLNEV